MSVYKKLHQVQAATRSLSPNTTGQTGAATYGYVSGAKLLGCIRPLMDKLGLLLTQEVLGITNTPMTYPTRNGEKTEMFTTLHLRFTWIDSEDESTMVNEFFANGMNAWDKGLGSALTYAERYYLMKTFHIATDEDDIDALVKDEAIRPATPAPAPAASAPAPAPAPRKKAETTDYLIGHKGYYDCIKNEAEGKLSKSGKAIRDVWAGIVQATPQQLAQFDQDVANYRAAQSNL